MMKLRIHDLSKTLNRSVSHESVNPREWQVVPPSGQT